MAHEDSEGVTRRSVITATGAGVLASALPAGGPARAAAPAPHGGIGSPTHLTVGDRPRPLDVEGAPSFGWFPQDGGGDEIQTAYQVRVVRETDSAVVWDSGKVSSSAQQYIPYAGPPLRPGTGHTWTVRTWNRAGRRSPWAPEARFETGLGDGDWEGACWVRRQTAEPDDYTLARTETAVGPSPVVRARAYTSAFHQYRLYLNGREVDDGPAFAYPGEAHYQAADVTEHVQAGEALAIGVVYHWYGGGQGRPAAPEARGMLLKLVIEHADGTRQVVVSDGSWRVRRAAQWQQGAPRRNGDAGDYVEWIDARAEPRGWSEPGYDDSAAPWTDAAVVGKHPVDGIGSLTGQETRLAKTVLRPVSVTTLPDGAVVADFGRVVPARPVIRFRRGVSGRRIDLRTSYALTADGHASTGETDTQGSDLSMRYTQTDGEQEMRAFLHWGWRYLEILPPGPGEELAPDDLSAVVEHTDACREAAEFDSSDPTLNAVWGLVRRSALYSVQHQFVDTPTREKGQFLGDAVDISYATMAAWRERAATRRAIREFAASQRRYWPDGRLNAVYPNGDGGRDIPDYTEMYADWVWRYYRESGDLALVAEVYPTVRAVADYVRRHVPTEGPTAGLVTDLTGGSGPYRHGIVDWPASGRYGYDMDTAVRTTVNALAYRALRAAAALGEALGEPGARNEEYARRAARLRDTANRRLRRADGVYVDGLRADGTQSPHASQHAGSYAVAYGLAPAEDRGRLAQHLADRGMAQGPMTAHWLLQALSDADRPDAVLARLTDPDSDGWANILRSGGTFTWESWRPSGSESYSHGWGAQAAVDILETLLGVRTAAPGAAAVDIMPPREALNRARGTVHTQRGPVAVDWRRSGRGVVLGLEVPVNVRARVLLPAAEGVRYKAAGTGAPRFAGTEGGRAVFETGSGRSVFTPTSRA